MKRVLSVQITITVACLCLLSFMESAQAHEDNGFKYEITKSISPYELWHATAHPAAGERAIASITYYEMDPEDTVEKEGWSLQGWIIGGLGDLGSTPIAIRLWTRDSFEVLLREGKNTIVAGTTVEKTTAVFAIRPKECKEKKPCKDRRFSVSIAGDGKVYINEKLIGISVDVE